MWINVSAPGSIMLLGEYAVLDGGDALVCAVNQRIEVLLSARSDLKIDIQSALGRYETDIAHLEAASPFQFVLATIKYYQSYLKQGFTLTITSGFSDRLGLGSSAAVTVATLSALSSFLHISLGQAELIKHATAIIQSVQGLGSGADVAASVLGGMVAYRQQSFFAEKLDFIFPITLIYSGFKTPTPLVVRQVTERFLGHHDLFEKIKKEIRTCAAKGIQAVRDNNQSDLGQLMSEQQQWMNALGVSTPLLQSIVDVLGRQPRIAGAKISGSGLGDCIVGLGEGVEWEWPEGARPIAVQMTTEGVVCEKTGCG